MGSNEKWKEYSNKQEARPSESEWTIKILMMMIMFLFNMLKFSIVHPGYDDALMNDDGTGHDNSVEMMTLQRIDDTLWWLTPGMTTHPGHDNSSLAHLGYDNSSCDWWLTPGMKIHSEYVD